MIYAIARGMDDITRQRLFNLSGLGMEYFNIIQNLIMLGVSLSRVGIEYNGMRILLFDNELLWLLLLLLLLLLLKE